MKVFGFRQTSRLCTLIKILFLVALVGFALVNYFWTKSSEVSKQPGNEGLTMQLIQDKVAQIMQRGIMQVQPVTLNENMSEKEKAELLGLDDGITDEARRIMKELNITNAGENGEAVIIPENVSDEIKRLNQTLWDTYGYNALASSMVSLNRALPDNRSEYCKNKTYPHDLPKVSVIIQFHDDDWMLVMRTIHSVLLRTPDHLLEEILLVYDLSTREYFDEKLDDYIRKFPKIRLIRSTHRQGVIGSRVLGYRNARGPVLFYLDSHIEVTPGWIEPVLARIKEVPNAIMWPKSSGISEQDMKVWLNDFVGYIGGFSWSLGFDWLDIREYEGNNRTPLYEPKQTVTFCGGFFAIRKDFLKKIGLLDLEFEVWGGEDVELAFRTWMCGGRIEYVPCSVVAHVYKSHTYRMDTEGKGGARYNTDRIAEVWLDEYKRYYYRAVGDTKTRNYGDISERLELKKKLNCKPFKWFIENIHPNIKIPENLRDPSPSQNLSVSN